MGVEISGTHLEHFKFLQDLPVCVHEAVGSQDPKVTEFLAAAWRKPDPELIKVETLEAVTELIRSNFEITKVLLQFIHVSSLQPVLSARWGGQQDSPKNPCTIVFGEGELLREISGVCKQTNDGLAFALARRSLKLNLAVGVPRLFDPEAPLRLLVVDGLTDASNVGSVMRVGAAFGVSAVICSNGCCDPFHPRAVRTSKGFVFRLPVIVGNLSEFMLELRNFGVTTASAIVQPDALFLDEVQSIPRRWALVVGSEHFGVSDEVRQSCDLLLKARMAEGVDSLNVVVSAGVLLHGCAEREAENLEKIVKDPHGVAPGFEHDENGNMKGLETIGIGTV